MRFEAEQLHRIRRGDVTATVRQSHGMKPSGYVVGTFRAIERVEDVRRELADGGVEYERHVDRLEEWVEITGRYRDVLTELRDDVVKAAGFETLEELVDHFRADYGGPAYQMVWVVRFRMAHDRPRLLAWPDARDPGGHGDYVHSAGGQDAMQGEPEAIDEATQAEYSKRGRARHARFQKKSLEQELAACRTPDERHQLLVARAREAGVDVRNELRSLERRLIQKIERSAA